MWGVTGGKGEVDMGPGGGGDRGAAERGRWVKEDGEGSGEGSGVGVARQTTIARVIPGRLEE